MRSPLVAIAVAFAAGIWSAPYFFLSASQQVFWLAVLFLAAVVLLAMRRHFYGLVLALAGFFLCGTFLAAEEHSFLPPDHIESLAQRGMIQPEEMAEITGWVASASIERPGSEYFDFELTGIKQSDTVLPVEGRVRLYYYAPRNQPPKLDIPYGTVLSIPVRNLRRPRNFMTPGFYDQEASMERQDIYFTGTVRRAVDPQILPGRGGSRWRGMFYRLRGRLLSNLDLLYPPREGQLATGAVLKAVLLSDDNWLSPDTAETFRESGTYHLLVVAGLHVAALTLAIYWILARLRLPDWLSSLVVAVAVTTYVFLTNARLPVVRAALMVLIYLAARLVYRQRALLNSVAAAALILLIAHPSDLREPGFQLSFLAVLIIAAVAVPLVEWTISPYSVALRGLDETERDIFLQPRQAQFRQDVRVLLDYLCNPARLSEKARQVAHGLFSKGTTVALYAVESVVAVSLLQLGLSLSMVNYFNRVAWSGMAANLLVMPLMAVIVPGGFLLLLASLIWWPAAVAGSKPLGVLVSLLYRVVAWSAHLPRLDRRVPAPPLWISGIFIGTLLLIAALASHRSRLVWLPIAALIPLALILTLARYPARITAGRLELTALDVGQGDSLFVTFPKGRTMLVDGGGELPIPGEPPPRLDMGESVVSPYLWSRYLQKVDIVVLTHAHWDHLGGLLGVLRNFRVGELWIGPGPRDSGLQSLLQLAASRGVPVIRKQSGDKMAIDGIEMLVLSPPGDWNPKNVSDNDSLVMRLGYGPRHILLTGDLVARMEKRLVGEDLPVASDIMKVPHHGSRSSTTAPFLSRVAPRFGIISVGAFNRYGHPNQEVLDALQQARVETYRTDGDGSITVSTDGNRIELETFRDSIRPWPPFHLYPAPLSFLFPR